MKGNFYALEDIGYGSLCPKDWVALYDGPLLVMEKFILQSYNRMLVKLSSLAKGK